MCASPGVMTEQMIPSERFTDHLEFHKNLYNALKHRDAVISGPHFKEHRQAVKRHFTRIADNDKGTTGNSRKPSQKKNTPKGKTKGS